MFCNYCGNQFPNEAVFCNNCGNKVVSVTPPFAGQPAQGQVPIQFNGGIQFGAAGQSWIERPVDETFLSKPKSSPQVPPAPHPQFQFKPQPTFQAGWPSQPGLYPGGLGQVRSPSQPQPPPWQAPSVSQTDWSVPVELPQSWQPASIVAPKQSSVSARPQPQSRPGRPRHWYGNGRRVFYGSLWSFYTVLLVVAFVQLMSNGSFTSALLSAGLAFLTGFYSYRIWTWRARRLWLLIIF